MVSEPFCFLLILLAAILYNRFLLFLDFSFQFLLRKYHACEINQADTKLFISALEIMLFGEKLRAYNLICRKDILHFT